MSMDNDPPSLFELSIKQFSSTRQQISSQKLEQLLTLTCIHHYFRPHATRKWSTPIYNYPEQLRLILDSLPEVDRWNAVTASDRDGCTALHRAAHIKEAETFGVILSSFNSEDQWKLLNLTNNRGYTSLQYSFMEWGRYYIIYFVSPGCGDIDIVSHVMRAVTPYSYDRWCEIASKHGFNDGSILHSAVWSLDFFQMIYKSFNRPDAISLLHAQTKDGRTVLHAACEPNGNADVVNFILYNLTPEERYELVNTRTESGGTTLQYACQDPEKLGSVLGSLSARQRVDSILIAGHRQQTVFHTLSCLGPRTAELVVLIRSIDPSDRCQVLQNRDINGCTALHQAAGYVEGHHFIEQLLSYFNDSECIELLSIRRDFDGDIDGGNTPLHTASYRHPQNLAAMLNSLTDQSSIRHLVALKGLEEQTVLQKVIAHSWSAANERLEVVKAIRNSCNEDEMMEILLLEDDDGRQPLDSYLVMIEETYRYVLESLELENRLELIRHIYTSGGNMAFKGNHLEQAIYYNDVRITETILDLAEGNRMTLLTGHNEDGRSPIDLINSMINCDALTDDLARDIIWHPINQELPENSEGHYPRGLDILNAILARVDREDDRIQIMKLALFRSMTGYQWLLLVIRWVIENHQNYFSASSFLELIGERNEGIESHIDETSESHCARMEDSPNYLPMVNTADEATFLHDVRTKTLDVLCSLRTEAKLIRAAQIHHLPECHDVIQNIIEREPLTSDQIQQLSPHSRRYIIPHHTNNSKRYALILFCAAGRQGAVGEADNLEQALAAIECDVIKMEWSSTDELSNMIDSSIGGLANCSLLFVCIMSHGHRGTLSGGDNSEVPVNDILHQLTHSLPEYLPMILLVQACQGFVIPGIQPDDYSSESDPATPSHTIDPHNSKHIVLLRPHTVLLLATVTGGEAIRGAFTGAVADEILQSDGRTEIHSMFTGAVYRMSNTDPDQTPEFRSTLMKALILPPIINNTATIPQT